MAISLSLEAFDLASSCQLRNALIIQSGRQPGATQSFIVTLKEVEGGREEGRERGMGLSQGPRGICP